MKLKIAPSILSADFGKLNEEIKEIESHADMLHIDVMDGHFVPNITIGPVVIRKIKSKLPLDVHLMIENPETFISQFAEAGANIVTVHSETCKDLDSAITQIKRCGCKAAVAINPNSSLSLIGSVIDKVDMVLVMSVFPGFAGQKFIPDVLIKVSELRKLKPNLDIQIDGGINEANISEAVKAGANIIVVGSSIFAQKDRIKAITKLKEAIKNED